MSCGAHTSVLILAAVWTLATTIQTSAATLAEEGVISIKSCQDEDKYVFMPDFTALCQIEGKTNVNGFVSAIFAFISKEGIPETSVAANAATTQYQGHYVWKVDDLVSGFGTYTASKTSRSFGWIFLNDTGSPLRLVELEFTYGQWGTRNSQVDTLVYEWQISPQPILSGSSEGWTESSPDSFASPYTTTSDDASFPVFRRQVAQSRPGRLAPGAYLAIRFTDTCPVSGSNAHLGLSAFLIAFQPISSGLMFSIQ